jgi:hypothetical protein
VIVSTSKSLSMRELNSPSETIDCGAKYHSIEVSKFEERVGFSVGLPTVPLSSVSFSVAPPARA